MHQPRRQCALGVRLFQAGVTTDKRLRFYNQDRLRAFIAAHPQVQVFSAHDPTFGSFSRVPARCTPVEVARADELTTHNRNNDADPLYALLEFGKVVVGEGHGGDLHVLLQMCHARRAGDQQHVVTMRPEPGQTDLGGRRSDPVGHCERTAAFSG